MKQLGIAVVILLTTHFVPYVDSCQFPSALSGSWYASVKGELTINQTGSATTIPSYKTNTFGTVSLTCHLKESNQYVFKSETFSYLGLDFEVYLCFKLQKKVSSKKYIYYMGSVENTDADDERLKTELITSNASPTVAQVCDRTTFAAGSEHIFLKADGNELNSVIDCPFSIRAKKWEYTFQSTGSVLTYCSSDSQLKICGTNSLWQYNYTACSTIQAYSASGLLRCMYVSRSNNVKYVHVYNTDASTDESTTFRFTCYVIQNSGDTMYATQHPQQCLTAQTPTSVASPGAVLVFTEATECPYDASSTVISTASAVGVSLGVLFIIVILLGIILIWYYYKKRKERQAIDKLPLQRAHPANKRLTNGDLYRDGKIRDSKTPATMNGDVKLSMERDPSIRRENSIHISMTSRGGSGVGGLEAPEPMKIGPIPVEEPEKVNQLSDEVIIENENEAALASTFLPRTPDQRAGMHFTDEEIKEIEKMDAEKKDDDDDDFDMDDIDDELGLPRLSRAFTPVIQPEEATLPSIAFKKRMEEPERFDDDIRADGIRKVKLKKNASKKKRRVLSSKHRPKSAAKQLRAESFKETPFLERIRKVDQEKADFEQREKIEKEMKQIENEVIKARLAKEHKAARTAPGSKYVVDGQGGKRLQSTDKGALSSTSANGERRRFGDPPSENTRKNRKRTPRLRHPMEIQADSEEVQDQEILKKADEFWKEEKRARSGRRRDHPEAVTIPSVKEDPFDHREYRNADTSAFSQARSGKSASGMRSGMERENSAFIEPRKDPTASDDIWDKASSLWHYKNQPIWGNLNHH